VFHVYTKKWAKPSTPSSSSARTGSLASRQVLSIDAFRIFLQDTNLYPSISEQDLDEVIVNQLQVRPKLYIFFCAPAH
jgi:hypothetical protein